MKKTFKQECLDAGVDYHRALKRRQAGMAVEKIFEKEYVRTGRASKHKLSVHGIDYPNVSEACRVLNPEVSKKTIIRRIKEGMTPEEAFDKKSNPSYANGIIYKVTQLSSGKIYIGLTIQDLSDRWKRHRDEAFGKREKSLNSLQSAIKKYGDSDFKIEIIDRCVGKNNLEDREKYWIKKLNSIAPHGFNLNFGGISGGSIPRKTIVEGVAYPSKKLAGKAIAEKYGIEVAAALKRIEMGRTDVKAPSKAGKSISRGKEYKAWDAMKVETRVGGNLYNEGLDMCPLWRNDFLKWLNYAGKAPTNKHRWCRKDKNIGFYEGNCAWMTPSEDIEYRRKSGRELFNGVKPKHVLNHGNRLK